MTRWLSEVQSDINNIQPFVDYYEDEFEIQRKDLICVGILEQLVARLPGQIEDCFRKLQDIEAVLEFLNIKLQKEKTISHKKFLENYNRSLSSSDIKNYVEGEDNVVTMKLLVNLVALTRNKWLGLSKGLDSKNFMLSNIVKLRAGGLEDSEISIR